MHLGRAVLALIALQCSHFQAADLLVKAQQARPKEDPDADSFRGRVDTAIAVIGKYLYMVGGNVAHVVGDDPDKVSAINATLSIPLSENWEARTVKMNSFAADAGPQHIWGHKFWVDERNDQLLLWGGSDLSKGDQGARERKLWKLKPDNKGGGQWTTDDVPNDIRRTTRGGYETCGGVGYLMGGRGTELTDKIAYTDVGSPIMVPGLITYDLETKEWHNDSMTDVTPGGTWVRGDVVCVEMPNRSPKLLLFGGAKSVKEEDTMDFDYVHYWDPEKRKWLKQETAGTRPPTRVDSCAVGVPGPNGTYDIFVYSGWEGTFQNGKVLQDIWILSIPAFRWFQGSLDNAQGRSSHRCVRHGSQMIVVGGGSLRAWWKSKDTLDRGIGVMDLNSVSWKAGFEAKSEEYRSPAEVRDWYEKHGYKKTIWENKEVEKAFGHDGDQGSTSTGMPPPSDDAPTEAPTEAPPESSSNTPAIVGGTVGGLAGLAALSLCVWGFVRRRRRRQQMDSASSYPDGRWGQFKAAEVDGTPPTGFSPAVARQTAAQELDAVRREPVELP